MTDWTSGGKRSSNPDTVSGTAGARKRNRERLVLVAALLLASIALAAAAKTSWSPVSDVKPTLPAPDLRRSAQSVGPGQYLARTDVLSVDLWRLPWQGETSRDIAVGAHGMVDTRFEVVREDAAILLEQKIGDRRREVRPQHLQRWRRVVAHVPASHGEATVVGVVIEVVVGEDEVIHIQRRDACLYHFVCSARAAVEHDLVLAHLYDH